MKTGQILHRLRLERGDKLDYIAALVGVCAGTVGTICNSRDVPDRWLPLLPAEYALPLIAAEIAQHTRAITGLRVLAASLAKEEKPQAGGPPGASVRDSVPLPRAPESHNHNLIACWPPSRERTE